MAESIVQIASLMGVSVAVATAIISIIIIWEIIWTGLAMWKAAKKNHLTWFICFLIISFFAIPEIVYLTVYKDRESEIKKRKK